jgi:shikimate dehydrogenase
MSTKTIPTMCWSVAANPSPLGVKLHDAGYATLGLDFKYVAIGSDEIAPIVDSMRRLGVRGLGVSMPHKLSVIEHLDEVSEDVRVIGACNTVVNTESRLHGYNTDWVGASRAIEEEGLSDCASALIVGGGGVARAIAYALKKGGMNVDISTRSEGQGQQLVSDLGLRSFIKFEERESASAELLVNATPDSGLVRLSTSNLPRGVFDVVFNTRTTPLTRAARELGVSAVAGWRMLLLQAAAQFELYTGTEAPLSEMGRVLEAALPE